MNTLADFLASIVAAEMVVIPILLILLIVLSLTRPRGKAHQR
jgi:hypothetical protein